MGTDNTTNLNVKKSYTDPKTGKFVKGNPGGGRTPGSVSVVEAIKRKLLECPDGNKKTYLELLVARYFKQAIQDGDTQIIKDLINRVDGMPLQKQEIMGDSGIKVSIVDYGTNNQPSAETAGSTKEG